MLSRAVTGSTWNSITPGLTAPVTYFSADVVDANCTPEVSGVIVRRPSALMDVG